MPGPVMQRVWLGYNAQLHTPPLGQQMLGNGHRVYSPALMRFQSPDRLSPFGRGGVNAYAYCGGDPINRIDPSGRFFHWIALGIGAAGLTVFTGSVAALSREDKSTSRILMMVGVGLTVAAAALLPASTFTALRKAKPQGGSPFPELIPLSPRRPQVKLVAGPVRHRARSRAPATRSELRPEPVMVMNRFSRPHAKITGILRKPTQSGRSSSAPRERIRFNDQVTRWDYPRPPSEMADDAHTSGSSADDAGSDSDVSF